MTGCLIKSEEQTSRLLAYCAGRLDAGAAELLRLHVDGCPGCAQVISAQNAIWGALDSWEAPPVSNDFNRRLYARIEAANAMPWYRRWASTLRVEFVRTVFAQPALPLAGAAIVIVAGFLLDHPARVAPLPSAQAAVSATDVEQVEKTLDDLEMLRQFDVSADQNSDDKEKSSKSM